MTTTNLVQFLVRQGNDSERKGVILASGELGYVNQTYPRLFVGDGVTYGGVPVASKLYWVSNWSTTSILEFVQIGDIVYSIADKTLYALSANPPTLSANYFTIAKNL
jgi:hypothetical protein